MFLSMVGFGQNYGNFQSAGSSGNVSLGAAINTSTKFYINTPNQNGAEIRATGSYRKGLFIYTSNYASTALEVQSTHAMSFAARFTGKVYFSDKIGLGITPLYLSSHEKLGIRNGMITTSGIGNGISLNGSYYSSTTNDFGTQRYGLFMGNGASLNLSMGQLAGHKPIVLSSFYGLGFDVHGGKMAMCQNGAVYIGNNDASAITRIEALADKDTWNVEYRLYVEKGIRTEKVKVDLKGNNWPDYVFEEDYNLPSLTSVETYINQNKHLPNVPSAVEVKKEGIDLGEMDKILLQKIEELTLYTIEQEKRLATQQAQLQQLQEQINNLKK